MIPSVPGACHTVGRFQPWAAAGEQAEGGGWAKGNTGKEEGNNTTTLR